MRIRVEFQLYYSENRINVLDIRDIKSIDEFIYTF